MIGSVFAKYIRNRFFYASAQFHKLIGSIGLHRVVSEAGNVTECVLADTLPGVALCCFANQKKGIRQMCNEDFPLDSSKKDETITITLTVEDVERILQEAQSPEGAAVLAANRTLWAVVVLICMEVMTAAERAAVWRHVEGLVEGGEWTS